MTARRIGRAGVDEDAAPLMTCRHHGRVAGSGARRGARMTPPPFFAGWTTTLLMGGLYAPCRPFEAVRGWWAR